MDKIEQLLRLLLGILCGVESRECGRGLVAKHPPFDPQDRFT